MGKIFSKKDCQHIWEWKSKNHRRCKKCGLNQIIKRIPAKSLDMQAERLAIAMQDRQGWILRADIIWGKQVMIRNKKKGDYTIGSAMPSSVKDRPNITHEHFYFFVKSKKYYSNLDAVRIPPQTFENRPYGIVREREFGYDTEYPQARARFNLRVRDAKRKKGQPQYKATKEEIERYKYQHNPDPRGNDRGGAGSYRLWKDKHPYKGKLLGMGKEAEKYGSPRAGTKRKSLEERMLDTKQKNTKESRQYNIKKLLSEIRLGIKPKIWLGKNIPTIWQINPEPHNFKKELGVDAEHFAVFPQALVEIPIKFGCPPDGIVLDPFCGSGTTLVVAKKLGRNYVGIELNPDYIKIAEKRLEMTQKPLL